MNGTKRHLVRAVVGGLLTGLGLALLLVVYKVVAFGTMAPFVVVAVCLVLRVALAFVLGRVHHPAAG